MPVTPCPVCGEPGGFHDPATHAAPRRQLDGRAVSLLDALAAEVGTGPALDDLLESLAQMRRGEGRVIREGDAP